MRRVLSLALAGLVLFGAGAAAAAPDRAALEQARSIGRGRALALAHCAGCHAIAESGRSRNPLSPQFRDLHTSFPVGDLIDSIAQGAQTGHPAMPQFRFTFEQTRDLIAFVQSVQDRPGKAPAP